MSANDQIWEDALGYSLPQFFSDYPTDMKPTDIVLAVRELGDELGSVLSASDIIDGLEVSELFEWFSGAELANRVEAQARTYVSFLTRWSDRNLSLFLTHELIDAIESGDIGQVQEFVCLYGFDENTHEHEEAEG